MFKLRKSMLNFVAITPHPPIIIPEIGRKDSKKCAQTIKAMQKLSNELAEVNPDTIIIISPHALIHHNKFAVYANPKFQGDFGNFGAPKITFNYNNDLSLAGAIVKKLDQVGTRAFMFSYPDSDYFELDHGEMVPLYYLRRNIKKDVRIIPIAYSMLNRAQHFVFGQAIREIAESDDFQSEKIALIASGDLSHRLIQGAPAGYNQIGIEFDEIIVDYLQNKHIREILELDEEFVESAGECGYRSILIALGALDGLEYQPEILSYEGPFGVGYLVANFKIKSKTTQ